MNNNKNSQDLVTLPDWVNANLDLYQTKLDQREIIGFIDPLYRIEQGIDSLQEEQRIEVIERVWGMGMNTLTTMKKVGLIGIAASQIGENFMMFTTLLRHTQARKIDSGDKLRIYINPKITYFSKKKNVIYEGCGSVGDIFGPVYRPEEVEVVATDEKGQKFSLRANGILARVIQHEMDHLNGIEYLERVTDNRKFASKEHYRKNIRNSKLQLKNSKVTKKIYKKLI